MKKSENFLISIIQLHIVSQHCTSLTRTFGTGRGFNIPGIIFDSPQMQLRLSSPATLCSGILQRIQVLLDVTLSLPTQYSI